MNDAPARMTNTLTTHSEGETAAAGRDLASHLSAGSIVLLFGDLGAGKTAFVRGLAEGLGVLADDVSSPTFTIMQEYRGGRLPLYHVDLYRLDNESQLTNIGWDDLIAEHALVLVEWPERAGSRMPADHLPIDLDYVGDDPDHRILLAG